MNVFKQIKTLVEVMNTALFYRKAQLLELVLVKCIVCECVHLTISHLKAHYVNVKHEVSWKQAWGAAPFT